MTVQLHTTGLLAHVALAATLLACKDSDEAKQPGRATPPEQTRRVAAKAGDLERMLSEIVATRACDRLRDMFRPLRAQGQPTITGMVWLQECDAFMSSETTVTLQLAGRGWQWVAKETESAGADFAVASYVPFTFSVEANGNVDLAYAPDPKVFTVWFTPRGTPKTTFQPIGDVEVDEQGVWASILGGLASAVGESPEERATDKVRDQGRTAFAAQFAQGLAVTINLCTGHVRSGLGHPAAGKELGPRSTVRREQAVLQPGGLLLHGPIELPDKGLALEASADVQSSLVCADDAVTLARANLEQRPPPTVPRAEKNASCPLVHVLQARPGAGPQRASYSISELVADLPALARCDRERRARPSGSRERR